MRNAFIVLAHVLIAFGFVSCSDKQKTQNQHDEKQETLVDDWNEMDDFHMIMAEAFHPYKDSANLVPAKAIAGEMAKQAATWANSPLPKRANSEVMKEKLQMLKEETEAFEVTVKSGSEKEIGDHLTGLHNLFHQIQEEWYNHH